MLGSRGSILNHGGRRIKCRAREGNFLVAGGRGGKLGVMKTGTPLLFCAFAPVFALLAPVAEGAALVTYGFGTTADLLLDPTTTVGGVDATALVPAGGAITLQRSGVNLGPSLANALGVSGSGLNSTEAFAVGAGRYFSFTLTPEAGQMISLESLTMNANIGSQATAPNFSLRMDTGSGFTTVATGLVTAESGASGTPFNAFDLDFTESTPGSLSNLTGTVTFQMVFYNAVTTPLPSGWAGWVRLDDLSIHGVVSPIPEPGSMMLGLVGAGLLLTRRARRR